MVKLDKIWLSAKEIEKERLCSRSARIKILHEYRSTGQYKDAPRSGMPPKHTKEAKRELARIIDRLEADIAAEATANYNSTRPKGQHLWERQTGVSYARRED